VVNLGPSGETKPPKPGDPLPPVKRSLDAIDALALVKLVKAGPYIGPRGGKWADPKHTIPWKEERRGGAAAPAGEGPKGHLSTNEMKVLKRRLHQQKRSKEYVRLLARPEEAREIIHGGGESRYRKEDVSPTARGTVVTTSAKEGVREHAPPGYFKPAEKAALDWKHEGGRSTVYTAHGSYRVFPSKTEPGKYVVAYEPTDASREHPFRETHSSKQGARGRAASHHSTARMASTIQKSDDPIDLLKGLYTFEERKGDPAGSIPDGMLRDYLCAFVEEALEHERRGHKEGAVNAKDPERWWAQRVFHELVAMMPRSKNLMRAGKGQTVDTVLAIMREKNLVVPDHPTADPQSGMGEKMKYSLKAPWSQADPTASRDLVLSRPETVRLNGESPRPFALGRGPQLAYHDSPVTARIDPSCPLHNFADLTKSQNLSGLYARCTCKKGDA
jgi:hypothetical protein